MTPCTEGDMNMEDEDACAGLSGKAVRKCKKKQKKGDHSAATNCSGLSGKQLKICKKKAKKGGQ